MTSRLNRVRGSPPRVWGKREKQRRRVLDRRFTPTRVGKTADHPGPAGPLLVHPHACGENGSYASRRAVLCWFTPTRVGKTSLRV